MLVCFPADVRYGNKQMLLGANSSDNNIISHNSIANFCSRGNVYELPNCTYNLHKLSCVVNYIYLVIFKSTDYIFTAVHSRIFLCYMLLINTLTLTVTMSYEWLYYNRSYVPLTIVKGKVFPYSLPSVGPGADPGVQAVSPQVT